MDCETARLALSAALDGEPSGADALELERHLDGCADCRAWRDAAHELRRRARITPVTAIAFTAPSDETLDRIRAAAGPPRRRSVERLRLALLGVAVAQVAFAFALLLFGYTDLQRDMGASGLAVAVGFTIAALRPARAFAISPVIGTVAGLLLLTAVIELAAGRTRLLTETPHVVVFIGWLLVHRIGRLTPPTLDSPERSLLTSLRRWVERQAGDVYADFTNESHPAGEHVPAEVAPAALAADSAAAPVVLRRGAA